MARVGACVSSYLWCFLLVLSSFAVQFCSAQNLRPSTTPDISIKSSPPDIPLKPVKPATLKFQLYRGSLVVLPGAIGDLHNLNLLLDTGTDPTILDKRVAERLGSKLQTAGLETIHRKVAAWRTMVPKVELGPIAARDVNVLVEDLSFLEKGLGVRVDALIGLDVLRPNNFVLDYRSHTIAFGTPALGSDAVAFSHGAAFVKVGLVLNGRPMELLLDTAASSLMLFRARWPELPNFERVQHSMNLGGDLTREPLTLDTLALGTLKLRRQPAFIVDSREDVQRDFDGIFNPALLGLRQLAFDFENARFAWSR